MSTMRKCTGTPRSPASRRWARPWHRLASTGRCGSANSPRAARADPGKTFSKRLALQGMVAPSTGPRLRPTHPRIRHGGPYAKLADPVGRHRLRGGGHYHDGVVAEFDALAMGS